MTTPLVLMMLAGALVGTGVAVAAIALTRGHPDLADALAAMDETAPRTGTRHERGIGASVLPLLRSVPGRIDDSDLDLLGLNRDRTLIARAGTAAACAAVGPALGVVVAVLDASLPLPVPAVFTIVGAVAGWTSYGRTIADRADRARDELRFALVSYLQQVGLLRLGGAGVATALSVPARLLSDSWAMRRLRDEIDLAERSGELPWEGLQRFGARIDLADLADLSAIARTAGQDGGAVVDTLLARAGSLRDELLADEHAAAHRASGQMSTPGALQVFLIAAWVLFPAGTALLGSV